MPFRFGTRRSLGLGLGGGGAILKPQDVFATSLYTGNGGTQTITNGIDLAGKGGLAWAKRRDSAGNNFLHDTARGTGKYLLSNATDAEGSASFLTSFNADGFTVASSLAAASATYASWSFARAAKFFDTNIFTHTNGTPTNIDLSSLGVVGDAVVKRRDAAGDWYAWHRSLTAGNNLRLNTTAAQSTADAFISVSGTTLTFSASAPSGNYTYQARAHDPSADGIVQCGASTANSGGTFTISHGWAGGAQWLIYKRIDATDNWYISDTTRTPGFSGNDAYLFANTSAAEGSVEYISQSNGVMSILSGNSNGQHIWAVIRAPT